MTDKYRFPSFMGQPIMIKVKPQYYVERNKSIPSNGDGILATLTFQSVLADVEPANITLSSVSVDDITGHVFSFAGEKSIDIDWTTNM